MFNPGDVVVVNLDEGLRATNHKCLCDDMERKGLKQIKGKVSETLDKVVWINFFQSIGGQSNGLYGIPINLVHLFENSPVPSVDAVL